MNKERESGEERKEKTDDQPSAQDQQSNRSQSKAVNKRTGSGLLGSVGVLLCLFLFLALGLLSKSVLAGWSNRNA